MTLTELKGEVSALGFEAWLAESRDLVLFANRALRRIFSDRRTTRTVKIFVPSRKPKRILESFTHKGGECEELELLGKAYCIELSGEGSFTVKDGDNEYRYDFNTDSGVYKGFIEEGGSIRFSGEHSFFVRTLATFDSTYGSDISSIPDADGRTVVDISRLFGDFLSFVALPKDKSGKPVAPILMENGTVTLDGKTHGDLYLTYRRFPMPISADLPNAKIDVPEESKHLLPLLTASYICFENDKELSEYYRELYEEEIASLNRTNPGRISTAYHDVHGWA